MLLELILDDMDPVRVSLSPYLELFVVSRQEVAQKPRVTEIDSVEYVDEELLDNLLV